MNPQRAERQLFSMLRPVFKTLLSPPAVIARGFGQSMASQGFTYKWPRPAVTVDNLIFCLQDGITKILLIERASASQMSNRQEFFPVNCTSALLHANFADDPFKGAFALPGGFVDQDEDLDAAAARELLEETHVSGVPLTQFGAFGKPGRDPRGHTVTVAYYGVLPQDSLEMVKADDDAASAEWLPLGDVATSEFAFDHAEVVAAGLQRIVEVQLNECASSPPDKYSTICRTFLLADCLESLFGRSYHQLWHHRLPVR